MAATEQVKAWLARFQEALQELQVQSAAELFQENGCYWRDLLAFTWNIYTAESRADIVALLTATLRGVKPQQWEVVGEAIEADSDGLPVLQAFIRFETAVARGRGVVRISKGSGKCQTLLTAVTELKGHEELAGPRRPRGAAEGLHRDRKTQLEETAAERARLGYSTQPYCVIVGGGQAGIVLGARLRRLGVSCIILEKQARSGDSWRSRYKSLCLHDPVWFDHLPYLPFPDNWPIFSPKDKMADWLECYTKIMELDYWTHSECKSASYDEAESRWEVKVLRKGGEGEKEGTVILRPSHLVLATGMSGIPNIPSIPGADSFQGVLCHSSGYVGPEKFAGKKCVVIGSNTSAHDICADLWEAGADVTMVQRSETHIVRVSTVLQTLTPLYMERSAFPVEDADLVFASTPYAIWMRTLAGVAEWVAHTDANLYARLKKVGFLVGPGDTRAGLFGGYLTRGSGYYIDVGASDLVADGEIKLKSGVSVEQLMPDGVRLSNGEHLPAELVVYATGYGSMTGWAEKLVSKEVADKVGRTWGLGFGTAKDPGPWEGELRNMWKPTRQPGLWFHGGNLQQDRFYSLILALQIKARKEGMSTSVYGMANKSPLA